MDQDLPDAERVRDAAGVLGRGPAVAQEREVGRIVAFAHRHVTDRARHGFDRDVEETRGDPLDSGTRRSRHRRRERLEALPHDVRVERLVPARAEDRREVFRPDAAEQHLHVRDRERAAIPVARGAGPGARRLRADEEPPAVVGEHGSAAGRDGVDIHHRRLQPHARDARLEALGQRAVVERDVRRSPAHVEGDQPAPILGLRDSRGRDEAAGGAREHRIAGAKRSRSDETAIALHELEARRRVAFAEAGAECAHVAGEKRRQVGIHDRGVAAAHEPDERRGFVRGDHFREAELARERCRAPLVRGMAEAMHEDDRDALDAAPAQAREIRREARLVEGLQHFALGRVALVGLDDLRIERRGQLDVKVEEARPVLVADRERVAETGRRDERGRHAAALEEGIGRDGRADADHVDRRIRAAFAQGDVEDARDARVRRAAVLRQPLLDMEPPAGRPADDVGERAAPVDPELPAAPFAHGAQDNLSAAYTFRSCASAPPARRSQASR